MLAKTEKAFLFKFVLKDIIEDSFRIHVTVYTAVDSSDQQVYAIDWYRCIIVFRRFRIQDTVFTSGTAYEYSYS